MTTLIDTIDTNLINEEDCGAFFIDDLFKQVKEEPLIPDVLHDDESPKVYARIEPDTLLRLVELQIRMARGMNLINQANDTLEYFQSSYENRVSRDVFMSWVDQRTKLWTLWNKLKDNCASLVSGHKWVWRQYFEHLEEFITLDEVYNHLYQEEEERAKEEEIGPWFCTSDPEAIDDQVDKNLSPPEHAETLLITHMIETAKEQKPLSKWEEVPNRTGGYVPKVTDLTNDYLQEESLLELIDELESISK